MVTIILVTALSATAIWLGFQIRANGRLKLKLVDMEAGNKMQNSLLIETVAKVEELERKTRPNALTPEQEDFKAKQERQWAKVVEDLNRVYHAKLEGYKAEFDIRVKADYEKAVASIAFHTVEYKKSITKKRKETSRKTKASKEQKQYRSIDDD